MATMAPLLPGLAPDLARQQTRRQGLKASTWQRLDRYKRPRLRLSLPAVTLTPSLPDTADRMPWYFLSLWHSQVRHAGEHASLWGELGLNPELFVATFTHVPLVIVHELGALWQHAEGLVQVCWLDDVRPKLNARVHHWVHPAYRALRLSLPLGRQMLTYLFDEMGFLQLEGRTPTRHRGAILYLQRLGFRVVTTLPYGEEAWMPDGKKTITPVVQSILTIGEWQAAHPHPRVPDERTEYGAPLWDKF